MSSTPYIANDLSGLLLKYIDQQAVHAPTISDALHRLQQQPHAHLGYGQWCGYIAQLGEITDNPCIGIAIGRLIEPRFCGVLGHLALSCGTLAEAFARFARYQTLLYDGAGDIAIVDGKYQVSWGREHDEPFDTRHSDEILLVGLIQLARLLSGHDTLTPHRVGFMHAAPPYGQEYFPWLGDAIEYDQPQVFVEFTVAFLNLGICDRNPTLVALLDQQADALLRALPHKSEFDTALRRAVITGLHNGTPSLKAVSSLLHISSRTLHRRLEARGLTFGVLLQRIRQELAVQYLRDSPLSLVEISLLLGYSEQSAFSRAFKQWTGIPPGKF